MRRNPSTFVESAMDAKTGRGRAKVREDEDMYSVCRLLAPQFHPPMAQLSVGLTRFLYRHGWGTG
jgi:hypothetical protein